MAHPRHRQQSSILTPGGLAGGIPINPAAGDDDGQFDKQLPHDGWELQLGPRNTFLGELVGQIPRSGIIVMPAMSNARDDKEYHLIVHSISKVVDEHFAVMGVEVGDRVVVSGRPVAVFVNGMDFFIVEFNTIKAVLRRKEGTKFLGSVYGATAMIEGKAQEKAKSA